MLDQDNYRIGDIHATQNITTTRKRGRASAMQVIDDPNGDPLQTTICYNAQGLRHRVTSPSGGATNYFYEPNDATVIAPLDRPPLLPVAEILPTGAIVDLSDRSPVTLAQNS